MRCGKQGVWEDLGLVEQYACSHCGWSLQTLEEFIVCDRSVAADEFSRNEYVSLATLEEEYQNGRT
jgi:hypothetical protein